MTAEGTFGDEGSMQSVIVPVTKAGSQKHTFEQQQCCVEPDVPFSLLCHF